MYNYKMSEKIQVGIVGAAGYTGAELLRILALHPFFEVTYLAGLSNVGNKISQIFPSLALFYPELVVQSFRASALDGLDLVFLALPHGESAKIIEPIAESNSVVVDLSADFRLLNLRDYETFYGGTHPAPHLLDKSVLAIPEINRDQITKDKIIAVAGCYVTCATLGLYPLAINNLIETDGVIVNGASGVSGAGKSPKESTNYSTVNENYCAYSLMSHRHTPEMEQLTGLKILFTPHLVPMTRGILTTCYARPKENKLGMPIQELIELYRDCYQNEHFVQVVDESPSTKHTLGTNNIIISVQYDPRTNWILVLSALDNLVKGASGQAVQAANIAFGLTENAGLDQLALYP